MAGKTIARSLEGYANDLFSLGVAVGSQSGDLSQLEDQRASLMQRISDILSTISEQSTIHRLSVK